MKNRNLKHKNDWKTPKSFFNEWNIKDFFDPCPFLHDIKKRDGLKIEWKDYNFINPPYERKIKELFIKKAIEESKKGKRCIMLLPVSTSTIVFHDYILPNKKELFFIKRRIKFSWWNTKGERVENKTGMHDSMLVIF